MLKKIAYRFTPNNEQSRTLERMVKQYAALCERLADLAREDEREKGSLPTAIDLNNLARKSIDTNEEGIPYRFVGLAASRVVKALKTDRYYEFYDPEDGAKYSVNLDEKTVSVGLAGGIKDYPKLELSIATWEGRLRIAVNLDNKVADGDYLEEHRGVDARAGYPVLARVSAAENTWAVILTVNSKK